MVRNVETVTPSKPPTRAGATLLRWLFDDKQRVIAHDDEGVIMRLQRDPDGTYRSAWPLNATILDGLNNRQLIAQVTPSPQPHVRFYRPNPGHPWVKANKPRPKPTTIIEGETS